MRNIINSCGKVFLTLLLLTYARAVHRPSYTVKEEEAGDSELEYRPQYRWGMNKAVLQDAYVDSRSSIGLYRKWKSCLLSRSLAVSFLPIIPDC